MTYVAGLVMIERGEMEREDEGRSIDEIEITSEMVEAGERAILFALGGAVSEVWFPDKVAVSVYRAMAVHSPKEVEPTMIERGELRLFRATDRFYIKDRGVLWAGPCPFEWFKDRDGLSVWAGQWLISHLRADHSKVYRVIAVESFTLGVVPAGSYVGVMTEEIVCCDE